MKFCEKFKRKVYLGFIGAKPWFVPKWASQVGWKHNLSKRKQIQVEAVRLSEQFSNMLNTRTGFLNCIAQSETKTAWCIYNTCKHAPYWDSQCGRHCTQREILRFSKNVSVRTVYKTTRRSATRGHKSPGAESLRAAPKSPNNDTNTFFNTVLLLPKELRFEHGGAKLASCPRSHLALWRPWLYVRITT